MYLAAQFSPQSQWPGQEHEIPVLKEPGNGGILVLNIQMIAQIRRCAANNAPLLPKDRAVSRKIFPFHRIAKKMAATGSSNIHLYQRDISSLKLRTF